MGKAGFFDPTTGVVYYKDIPDEFGERSTARWESIRQQGLDYFSNISQDLTDYQIDEMVSYLRNQAQMEYAKEEQVLKDFFGVTSISKWKIGGRTDYKSIIQALNSAFNLKEAFNRMVSAIRAAENKNGSFKALGRLTPASYFGKNFAEKIADLVTNYCMRNVRELVNGTLNLRELDDKIKILAGDALRDTLAGNYGKRGEDHNIFASAADIVKQDKELRRLFGGDVFTRYNFPYILATIEEEFLGKDLTTDLLTELRSYLTVNSGLKDLDLQTVAGTVAEYIQNAIGKAMTQKAEILSMTAQTGKGSTADLSRILAKGKIEGKINTTLQTQYDNTKITKKEDAARAIETFQKQIDPLLNKSIIVYENVKKYNFGANFKGFRGGSRNILGFQALLNEVNYPRADQTINYIKNTMPGAIYEGNISQVRTRLARQIANFLFDDFSISGSGDSNAIHLMNLSNIVVPLSYILNSLANALSKAKNPEKVVMVNFNYGNNPTFTMADYPMGDGGGIRSASMEGSHLRWDKQRNSANSIEVSINILADFKALITGDIFSLID